MEICNLFSLNGRILPSLNVENMKLGPNVSPENAATTLQSTLNSVRYVLIRYV